jgi:hypothetical protein
LKEHRRVGMAQHVRLDQKSVDGASEGGHGSAC